jgi:hypothetical protein
MASGSFWSHCPKRKNHHTFFLSMFKQWKSYQRTSLHRHMSQIHPITKFMPKLIMFIEKTKHLYSRVEIKTLKQGKTMFGYQTLN